MASEIIKVTVDDLTGEFDVDLTGFHGHGCDAVIKAFSEIGKIKTHIHKPEFNAIQKQQITRKG
jgi:hypothetical protein